MKNCVLGALQSIVISELVSTTKDTKLTKDLIVQFEAKMLFEHHDK